MGSLLACSCSFLQVVIQPKGLLTMYELNKLYQQLHADKDFTFIAILGKENNREYYTINVPYADSVKLFKLVPYDPESKLLIQRDTHKKRIADVASYLEQDFASLPAISAVVEMFDVKHIQGNAYSLTIPKDVYRYAVDGQARLGGISKLLEKSSQFNNNTLAVKLCKTQGLKIDNQLFTDFNSAQIKPNKSFCIAMDSRALINSFTKEIIENVAFLDQRIDFTKASISQTSQCNNLWTLNQFTIFVQTVAGVTARSAESLLSDANKRKELFGFVCKYLSELSKHPQLKYAFNSSTPAKQTRDKLIVGTSVWLKSIALTGRIIYLHLKLSGQKKVDWGFMRDLESIDFSKDNAEWDGRCRNYLRKFEDKAYNHRACSSYLLSAMAIELPEELEDVEELVLLQRASGLKAARKAKKEQLAIDESIDREAA